MSNRIWNRKQNHSFATIFYSSQRSLQLTILFSLIQTRNGKRRTAFLRPHFIEIFFNCLRRNGRKSNSIVLFLIILFTPEFYSRMDGCAERKPKNSHTSFSQSSIHIYIYIFFFFSYQSHDLVFVYSLFFLPTNLLLYISGNGFLRFLTINKSL